MAPLQSRQATVLPFAICLPPFCPTLPLYAGNLLIMLPPHFPGFLRPPNAPALLSDGGQVLFYYLLFCHSYRLLIGCARLPFIYGCQDAPDLCAKLPIIIGSRVRCYLIRLGLNLAGAGQIGSNSLTESITESILSIILSAPIFKASFRAELSVSRISSSVSISVFIVLPFFCLFVGLTYRLDLSPPLAREGRGKAYFLNTIQANPTRIAPRIRPCAKQIAPCGVIATPPFLLCIVSFHSSPASVRHSQEFQNGRRRNRLLNKCRNRSFPIPTL